MQPSCAGALSLSLTQELRAALQHSQHRPESSHGKPPVCLLNSADSGEVLGGGRVGRRQSRVGGGGVWGVAGRLIQRGGRNQDMALRPHPRPHREAIGSDLRNPMGQTEPPVGQRGKLALAPGRLPSTPKALAQAGLFLQSSTIHDYAANLGPALQPFLPGIPSGSPSNV